MPATLTQKPNNPNNDAFIDASDKWEAWSALDSVDSPCPQGEAFSKASG